MNARPSLKHSLEWLALSGVMKWMRHGDIQAATTRAQRLALLGRFILRKEWHWANTNLRLAFGPQLSEPQIHHLATLAFQSVFCSFMEGMRSEDVNYSVEGIDHLRQAFALGRGVVATSVHLGSWESGLRQVAAEGFPLTVVYRHANNPLTEKNIIETRRAYGVGLVRRLDVRQTVRVLQQGGVLGLMVDINARDGAVTAPSLGTPAQCLVGAARLATRFRAPVVPMLSLRTGPGQARLIVLPALEPPGDLEQSAAFTATLNRCFDPWMLAYADQYNWLHARWRSRPDGTLWRADTPMETLWNARVEPFPPLPERLQTILQELS